MTEYLAESVHWMVLAAGFYLLTVVSVVIIRWKNQGVAYDEAWSSKYGMAVFAIFIGVLCRYVYNEGSPGGLFTSKWWHAAWVCIAVVVALIIRGGSSEFLADKFHQWIILPFIIYTIGSLGIVMKSVGIGWESLIALVCLLLQSYWLRDDFATNRINQPEYRSTKGKKT